MAQAGKVSSADLPEIQRLLTVLGYRPGPADGQMGSRTLLAIRQFQRREGLAVTGEPSRDVLARLQRASQRGGTRSATGRSDLGVTTSAADLRDQPTASAQVVASLPARAPVTVEVLSGRWARVRPQSGAVGWIATDKLELGRSSVAGGGSSSGSGFLRSLTGWLSPGSRRQSSGNTVTMGVRGLQSEDIEAAQPNKAQLRMLEQQGVNPSAARSLAKESGLHARKVSYPGAGSGASKGGGLFGGSGGGSTTGDAPRDD